jgi:hypothetical protein
MVRQIDVAMLFRYYRVEDDEPVIITVRGTFDVVLGITATQAWDSVIRGMIWIRS